MEYTVSVSRDAGYWVANIYDRGDDVGVVEVRRLAELEDRVHNLASEFDSATVAWDYTPALGRELHGDLANYRATRVALSDAQRRYENSQRRVAAGLREAGVSVRDAAELLNLSYQRVQQLMSSTPSR